MTTTIACAARTRPAATRIVNWCTRLTTVGGVSLTQSGDGAHPSLDCQEHTLRKQGSQSHRSTGPFSYDSGVASYVDVDAIGDHALAVRVGRDLDRAVRRDPLPRPQYGSP